MENKSLNVDERELRFLLKSTLSNDKAEELKLDDKIEDIGINSISFIKFMITLEEKFNIEFDIKDLSLKKMNTLKKIILEIEKKVSAEHTQ